MKSQFPHSPATVRPFRIWDSRARKQVPHAYFAFPWTAIDSAWKLVQWTKPGVALEVFDTTRPGALAIATMMRRRGGQFYRWVNPAFDVKHTKGK